MLCRPPRISIPCDSNGLRGALRNISCNGRIDYRGLRGFVGQQPDRGRPLESQLIGVKLSMPLRSCSAFAVTWQPVLQCAGAVLLWRMSVMAS